MNRTVILHFRVTPDEAREIHDALNGRTLSEVIRERLLAQTPVEEEKHGLGPSTLNALQ